MMKRFLSILSALLLAVLSCANAQSVPSGASITQGGLDLMQNSVRYPQISGMADEALQQEINSRIVTQGCIDQRLSRLSLLLSSPVPLTVTYEALLENDVFSCVLSSSGAVVNERSTHVWNTLNIDLTTGSDITFSHLFADPDAALGAIGDTLDFDIAPELSAHLQNSMLTPVPEQFTLSASGLTLYYPIDQLSTLSDRAGTVTFLWTELKDYLILEEGSILERIGANALMEENAASLRLAVESGMLPGIPVKLGGSVQEATDTYRMLTDPDLYQDGRMFALEDAAFRNVWLLTDALSEKWNNSIIKGLRLDRINLYSLHTGMTRGAAAALLGTPDASVTLDMDAADAYRLNPGTSDYYNFTGVQLRLHFNEEELLESLIITQTN